MKIELEFESREQAEHFFGWLCDGGGEQDFWTYCEYQDAPQPRIDYHTNGTFLGGSVRFTTPDPE